jgi:hypothetical protein
LKDNSPLVMIICRLEVTPQMRAILIDWLIQVQVHEELCQQTY